MNHDIRVFSIGTNNEAKKYLVKIYSNGTYYMNQVTNGKVFYRQWTRTNKRYAMSLLDRFNNEGLVKHISLNYRIGA